MKTIKTKSRELLIAEVPLNVMNYSKTLLQVFNDYYKKDNPDDTKEYLILGLLSELTDEQCEEFVDLLHDNFYIENIKCWTGKFYYNYNQVPGMMNQLMYTAKQSFISLLQSEGIDTYKEYLIVIINK